MKQYLHRYDVLYSTSDKTSEEIFEQKEYKLAPVYIETYEGAKNVAVAVKAFVPDVKRIQIDYAIYMYEDDDIELVDNTVVNEVVLKDEEWVEAED